MRVGVRCATLAEARDSLSANPSIVVCSLRLPDGSAFELLAEIIHRSRPTAMVMVAASPAPHLAQACRHLGAAGFLLKSDSPAKIVGALTRVSHGEPAFDAAVLGKPGEYLRLSARERSILEGVVMGRTNDEIASDLEVSRKTVEVYLSRLFARTSSLSRTELAVKALHNRWLDVPATLSFLRDRAPALSPLGTFP